MTNGTPAPVRWVWVNQILGSRRLLVTGLLNLPGLAVWLFSVWYAWVVFFDGTILAYIFFAMLLSVVAVGSSPLLSLLWFLLRREQKDFSKRVRTGLSVYFIASAFGWVSGTLVIAWSYAPTPVPVVSKFVFPIPSVEVLPVPALLNIRYRSWGGNLVPAHDPEGASDTQIFVLNPDSGAIRYFPWLEEKNSRVSLWDFTWSRSHQSLLLPLNVDGRFRVQALDRAGRLRTVLDVPSPRLLGDCTALPISPEIACRYTREERGALLLFALDGSGRRREIPLVPDGARGTGPVVGTFAFSPDEKMVAFMVAYNPSVLSIARTDGSGVISRTETMNSLKHIRWSPDGRQLASVCIPEKLAKHVSSPPENLFCMVDTGVNPLPATLPVRQLRAVLPAEWAKSGEGIHSWAWLPEGKRLAVVADWEFGCISTTWANSCRTSVYVMNADGTGVVKLANRKQDDGLLLYVD